MGTQGPKLWSWWGDPDRLPAKKKQRQLQQLHRNSHTLQPSDFVVAIATHKEREFVLPSGRLSRQAISLISL
jgi:hypothetical protein